ncbi:hypothetical protein C0W44_11385 [Photobacterium leiognathi subsp. mandapamensis]|nr:hypothetical protein C0W44_11385 [Photobacterium leiognathi subsp. mandapamensis]
MDNFTPISALIGGGLIGVSALILMIFNGRIAGISGIFARSLFQPTQNQWQLLFLVGLMLGPWLAFGYHLPSSIDLTWWQVIIGGFLVGLGSQLGSGCTSGHGVCGIGRLSVRSIVATCIFMASALITVGVLY